MEGGGGAVAAAPSCLSSFSRLNPQSPSLKPLSDLSSPLSKCSVSLNPLSLNPLALNPLFFNLVSQSSLSSLCLSIHSCKNTLSHFQSDFENFLLIFSQTTTRIGKRFSLLITARPGLSFGGSNVALAPLVAKF